MHTSKTQTKNRMRLSSLTERRESKNYNRAFSAMNIIKTNFHKKTEDEIF